MLMRANNNKAGNHNLSLYRGEAFGVGFESLRGSTLTRWAFYELFLLYINSQDVINTVLMI